MSERRILGIDPGSIIMGYGVIDCIGKQPQFVDMGVINLKKIETHFEKMQIIFEKTLELIDKHHPQEISIEAPFQGKNVQSMLKLGRAQGVAIAAGLHRKLDIHEYAPRKIKMSITGKGDATKEEVATLLQRMLRFEEMPHNLDATDGLAAAVCHFYQNNVNIGAPKAKSWKDFISNNPNRVK